MDDVLLARGMALTEAYMRNLDFLQKYRDGIESWRLDRCEQKFLSQLVFQVPLDRMLWCNRHVRQAGIEAIIDAMLDEYASAPFRERYFTTFCWDAGFSWERGPDIDLVSLKNIINHRIRRLGLHGIGVLEIDVLKNITGEPGRRLLAHVHCYCWPVGADFDAEKAARELNRCRGLRNSLDAPAVKIQAVSLYEISIAHLAQYMFKWPSRAKNRVPLRRWPGHYAFRDARLPTQSATRLVEILSHMEFGDQLFAIGDGAALATDIRRRFRDNMASLRGRKIAMPDDDSIFQIWKSIRERNGSRLFEPCHIVTRALQRANRGE